MKDLSPHPIARLVVPLVLATSVFAFIACDPGRSAAPTSRIETTPVTVEPDDEDLIPCGPRRVLQQVCQQCHQKPPVNGAPFPLVTRSNIVRVTRDGQIRDLMIQQLEVGRMPLSPVTIDYDSRLTLLDWLQAGAPAERHQSCEDGPTEDAGSGSSEPNDAGEPSDAGDASDASVPPPSQGYDGEPDDDTSPDASASD